MPSVRYWPKQTWASALHMSAFGGKADMTFCNANVCFCPKRTLACLSAFDGIGAESRVFVSDFLRGFEVRRIIGLHCRIEIIEYVDDNARFRRWALDCDRFAAEYERAVARRLSKCFARQRAVFFRETLRVSD